MCLHMSHMIFLIHSICDLYPHIAFFLQQVNMIKLKHTHTLLKAHDSTEYMILKKKKKLFVGCGADTMFRFIRKLINRRVVYIDNH